MNDNISRQAAIGLVTDMEFMNNTAKGILRDRLRKLPSAQPEIIRCKDCKWSEPVSGYLLCVAWEAKAVYKDDFCSDAERREDDNN